MLWASCWEGLQTHATPSAKGEDKQAPDTAHVHAVHGLHSWLPEATADPTHITWVQVMIIDSRMGASEGPWFYSPIIH